MSGGRERMGKQPLGRLRRLWERMPVLDRTAAIYLAVFVLLLAWVAFGSQDNCSGDMLCRLLGVADKTEAIKILELAIVGAVACWVVVVANRKVDAILDRTAAISLVVFVSLLIWVAFGSQDNCSGDTLCRLLGVTEKAAAIKMLKLAIVGAVAFGGVVVANRRVDAILDRTAAISLVVFVSLLAWVAFGSQNSCSGDMLCRLLGVTEKAAAIKLFGLAIAGTVAFWGVVVADRRAEAMAGSVKAADNTVEATEARNRQRAFKDGVEHLGSNKSSVRQGGAHALFRLALEDKELRKSIAGVLCAHIRETTGDKGYPKENEDKPSTEMQSLLRLLFTTETVDERGVEKFWEGITPDLNGGYFCGLELESAHFRGAKLNSAQFQRASLGRAQFQGASLEKAQFQGASLEDAQFRRVSLEKAQFQGASLEKAQFQGASLEKAQFQGASLEKAQFHKALLEEAQFQGASLREAQFQRASLREAQFQGASLREAQFQGASLREAQFQGAWLMEAQFQRASLEGSRFQGASLYMAGFQQAKFGQGSEYGDILDHGDKTAKFDKLVEQSKASAFHGASSERHVRKSFEERIKDRTDKESDFSKVIFSGGVTKEQLAEVKEALEGVSWSPDDPDFIEELIQGLESEVDQPESNTKPKEVIASLYGKEDAARWIREFREAMATVPETNQAA